MSNSEEVTLADPIEHVQIVRVDSISDVIDPRISPEEIATAKQLDETYLRQASDLITGHEHPKKHPEKTTQEEVCADEEEKRETLYVGLNCS